MGNFVTLANMSKYYRLERLSAKNAGIQNVPLTVREISEKL